MTITRSIRSVPRLLALLWLAAVTVLTTLLVLLTISIKNDPLPSADETVLLWVLDLDFPGLTGFSRAVSGLTNHYPILAIAFSGIVVLWLLGMNRAAVGFTIIGVAAGAVAFGGDELLGDYVGRSRPFLDVPETSFPSGHVFGSTVLFGFLAYLVVHLGLRGKALIGILGFTAFMILGVGFARMFEGSHWPSDVAAGYLLGGIGLLLLVPAFLLAQRFSWLVPTSRYEDVLVEGSESC